MVQITTCACGMVAIGVKMAHPLTDAPTLARFTRDWAYTSRALLAGAPFPVLSPVFDPQRLDRITTGGVDATQPDTEIVQRVRSLLMHHYDWWTSSDGTAPKVDPTSNLPVPRHRGHSCHGQSGLPMPLSDISTYTSARMKFRGTWEQACSSSAPSKHAISHQDALAAHVWALIIPARGLADDKEMLCLNMLVGIRTRISPITPSNLPRLDPSAVSCISNRTEGSLEDPGPLATRIRSSLYLFDAPALSALLHDMAHDVGLVRL